MNSTSIQLIFIAASLFCIFLSTLSYADDHLGLLPKSNHIVRTIVYPLSVKNLTSEIISHPQISVAGPHKCNLGQTVVRTEASLSYTETTDDTFNHNLIFSLRAIPPYGTRHITIEVEVQFSPNLCNDEPIPPKQYLKDEKAPNTNNTALILLVSELKSDNQLETIDNINTWINQNLIKTTYSSPERGALWAFEKRKGDCTEYAQLFVALSRLAGIPARRVSGYKIAHDTYLNNSDFHDWAQFYLDSRWYIADPYYNVLSKNEDHYIATRVHSPISRSDFFYRWESSDERLKISMIQP